MNIIPAVCYVFAAIVFLVCVIWAYRTITRYNSVFATGPWHKVTDSGVPLKGIPVLTEYMNVHHKYHGFRVDTYSTKLSKWMEADVWDQKVIAYAEIKAVKESK